MVTTFKKLKAISCFYCKNMIQVKFNEDPEINIDNRCFKHGNLFFDAVVMSAIFNRCEDYEEGNIE